MKFTVQEFNYVDALRHPQGMLVSTWNKAGSGSAGRARGPEQHNWLNIRVQDEIDWIINNDQ
jgi:hypothetical protein